MIIGALVLDLFMFLVTLCMPYLVVVTNVNRMILGLISSVLVYTFFCLKNEEWDTRVKFKISNRLTLIYVSFFGLFTYLNEILYDATRVYSFIFGLYIVSVTSL